MHFSKNKTYTWQSKWPSLESEYKRKSWYVDKSLVDNLYFVNYYWNYLLLAQESQGNFLRIIHEIENNPDYLLNAVKQIKPDVSDLTFTFFHSKDEFIKV